MPTIEKIKNTGSTILAYIVGAGLLGFGIYSLIIEKHWIILSLLVIVSILIVPFFILILGTGLEAGFRNQFPLDYLFHINNEIDFFKNRGFTLKDYIEPGSENPGVFLEKDGKIIAIKLDAPMNASKYTIQVTSPTGEFDTLEYDTSTEESEKTSKLIGFYEDLISE